MVVGLAAGLSTGAGRTIFPKAMGQRCSRDSQDSGHSMRWTVLSTTDGDRATYRGYAARHTWQTCYAQVDAMVDQLLR